MIDPGWAQVLDVWVRASADALDLGHAFAHRACIEAIIGDPRAAIHDAKKAECEHPAWRAFRIVLEAYLSGARGGSGPRDAHRSEAPERAHVVRDGAVGP